ncbi:MAG: flagellar FlbD family protein [Defluviitaleaceae bacterium]|nr:flagellar FlbD family protein [Defluviitaleaceae bacterium]
MIKVTKLNDREILINSSLIELIETTPDTTITMTTGRKIIVRESLEELIERIETALKR